MHPMHKRNPELAIAFMQASDIANELGHGTAGSDHLLLAMLTNLRASTYPALTEAGLNYHDCLERVVAHHNDNPGAAPADESVASTTLSEDREALDSIGIDLDSIRDQVKEAFDTDITEGWGERRSPKGDDKEERGRRFGGGRGRRGPSSRRFGPFGFGLSEELIEILQSVRQQAFDALPEEDQERIRARREERREERREGRRGERGEHRGARGHHGPGHHRGPEHDGPHGPEGPGFGPGFGGPRGPRGRRPMRGFGLTAGQLAKAIIESNSASVNALLGDVDRAALVAALDVKDAPAA